MQTNLPHYREPWFLERAAGRYRRFLALRRRHPTQFLVPTYDIDVVWHAHMVPLPAALVVPLFPSIDQSPFFLDSIILVP